MKKPVIIIISIVAIVIFVAFGYSQVSKSTGGTSSSKSSGTEVEYTEAIVDEAKESFVNNGVVEIKEVSKQYASSDGKIFEFYFEVGDEVSKGDVLFSYDQDTLEVLEDTLEDAKYSLEIAQINLNNSNSSLDSVNATYEIKEVDILSLETQVYNATSALDGYNRQLEVIDTEILRANENIEQAKKDYEKQQILYDNGIITLTELESYEKAVKTQEDSLVTIKNQKSDLDNTIENAKYSLEVANQNLDNAINPNSKSADAQKEQASNSIKISEINLEQAQNTVLELEEKISEFKTGEISEYSGVITAINTPIGTTVQKGMTVAEITNVNKENMIISIDVDQKNISKVEIGQEVEITSTGIGDEVVVGKVGKIMPTANVTTTTNGNVSTIGVEIIFDGDLKGLKAGFLVDCEVIVNVNEDAIFVPILSILTDEDGKNYVYIIDENNIAEKRDVVIGTINGTNVEVDNVEISEKVVSSKLKYITEGDSLSPISSDATVVE